CLQVSTHQCLIHQPLDLNPLQSTPVVTHHFPNLPMRNRDLLIIFPFADNSPGEWVFRQADVVLQQSVKTRYSVHTFSALNAGLSIIPCDSKTYQFLPVSRSEFYKLFYLYMRYVPV